MTNAHEAIDASIAQNRIVWMEWDIDDDSDLLVECEDNNEYESEEGLIREFWGKRNGHEWRVCLIKLT